MNKKNQNNDLEFEENPELEYQYEYENAMMLLAEMGVPFLPDGTPLGIGWD